MNGHAEAALYEPNNRHIEVMREAESRAQDAERGMWGEPCDYDETLLPPPPPEPEPEPEAPAPEPEPEPEPAGDCEEGYDPCVPRYPPDVNGSAVNGPIRVTGSDPHGLDADGDGVGCEG